MSRVVERHEQEHSFIRKAQAGDRAAFDELVRCHAGALDSAIRSKMGPRLAARIEVDDIAQETLLRAFKGLREFCWRDSDSFVRWLHRIAANVIREAVKREKRDCIVPTSDSVPDSGVTQSKAMRREERFDRLQGVLAALNPEQRQAVFLARIERLPIREIGLRMNRSPAAVSQLIWRAMQELKASFPKTDSLGLPDRTLRNQGE